MFTVVKTFEKDQVWTCPAGVTRVELAGYRHDVTPVSMNYNCALVNQDGVVYAWGKNLNGQLGDATVAAKSSATIVVGAIPARQVVTNGASIHVLRRTGEVYSAGLNIHGNLGDSSVAVKSSPVLVSGSVRFKKIASSGVGSAAVHVVGLAESGDLYGWGYNHVGQLGDGTRVPKSSPTLVAGGKAWKDVFCAGYRTFAIDDDDNVYAWGSNAYGALGNNDNSVPYVSSPVLVSGGLKAREIADSMMITKGGDLYAWGNNFYGQVGDGTVGAKSSPVLVQGGLKWRKISSYNYNDATNVRHAIDEKGRLFAWGLNTRGYFGNDDITGSASSPTLVSVLSTYDWNYVVASNNEFEGMFAAVTGIVEYDSLLTLGNLWAWGDGALHGMSGQPSAGDSSSPNLVVGANAAGDRRIILAPIDREFGEIDFAVVPGREYRVFVNDYIATFGAVQVGTLLKGIRLRY